MTDGSTRHGGRGNKFSRKAPRWSDIRTFLRVFARRRFLGWDLVSSQVSCSLAQARMGSVPREPGRTRKTGLEERCCAGEDLEHILNALKGKAGRETVDEPVDMNQDLFQHLSQRCLARAMQHARESRHRLARTQPIRGAAQDVRGSAQDVAADSAPNMEKPTDHDSAQKLHDAFACAHDPGFSTEAKGICYSFKTNLNVGDVLDTHTDGVFDTPFRVQHEVKGRLRPKYQK